MREVLAGLVGSKVTRFQRVHDYHQLSIGNETIDIFNPMAIEGPSSGQEMGALEGLELKDVEESDDRLTLTFEHGLALRVDLRDGSYVGPEAVVYHREDGSAVVW